MSDPEALLPHGVVTQHLAQLHAIADALAPTDVLKLIVDSGTALQHPQLMQYACGTEHLELAIAYLERAIGVKDAAPAESQSDSLELPGFRHGVRHVEVLGEALETTPPPEAPET